MRGPATEPSLVTWPTSTVVSVRCLASAVSAAVTSRIWVTPPGTPSMPAEPMVCTESTISRAGLDRLDVAEQRGEVGLGGQVEVVAQRADPVGPQPDLGGGLLAGDVQHPARPRGQRPGLQQQRGLADAGLAGQQHDRAGHQAAAEHPVELVHAGRPGPGRGRRRPADRDGGRARRAGPQRTRGGPGSRPAGWPPRRRAPGLALAAAAGPFRRPPAALGALVHRWWPLICPCPVP